MGTRRFFFKTAARLAISLLAIGVLLAASSLFSSRQTARAQLLQDLTPFLRLTLPGGVTAAGVGLRGQGTGNITLDSVPEDATVERAFLYWATFGLDGDFTTPTWRSAGAG